MSNKELPIWEFKQKIVKAVKSNQVVIISGETGCGKSTQVPQMLLSLSAGYKLVVTEPRRLAARSLAERVAEEHGSELGDVIGYRTAFERCDSARTRCVFCTDGLELVRELYHDWRPDVLVIDEVHEWNLHMETLVAFVKDQFLQFKDRDFKLLIMSATLEADQLSDYLDGAPVIKVPGRLFPIEKNPPRYQCLEEEVMALVKEGRNVLVFQPGKYEITESIRKLEKPALGAKILPLHGELDSEEQDKTFQHYSEGKVVVATNVAQTSITIDDIDAVVDSGLEKRIEVIDGVESLHLRRIAQADERQRMGRAGRCKSGIYVNYYQGEESQLEFSKPEIQRVRLDNVVLRLASVRMDATELEFFHQPSKKAIIDAKQRLFILGAMDDQGKVTPIGREIAKLPIVPEFGRMIIEAKKLNVLNDVLIIVSCLEVAGICDHRTLFPKQLTDEQQSDFLAQLDIFQQVKNMNPDLFQENGINYKFFYRASEIYKKLIKYFTKYAYAKQTPIDLSVSGDRRTILRACLAGMVGNLYRLNGKFYFNGKEKSTAEGRHLSSHSVLRENKASWVIGLPLNFGGDKLLTMASAVDPKMLVVMAPHLVRQENRNFRLCRFEEDKFEFERVTIFNDLELPDAEVIKAPLTELSNHLSPGENVELVRQQLEAKRKLSVKLSEAEAV